VSLHQCECGKQYEQRGSLPPPPCPTCEKTSPKKRAPEGRGPERIGEADKRTKHKGSKDKGETVVIHLAKHTNETRQRPAPHVFLDLMPASNTGISATGPATPFQAPIHRKQAEIRFDSASRGDNNTSPPRGTQRIARHDPLTTKSYRGLRNTGNTCFLNATIQCLGAIDEVSQMYSPTKKSTITQNRLRDCVKELQRPGTAYMPTVLIQQIPDLIGDPADAHELLIALINDVSEPVSQLFQGQMTSTIKCSSCDSTTSRTDIAQDISVHIEEDVSSSLVERLHDFFHPETLEGTKAYWCDNCQKPCRATKTLLYTRTPTILIIHLKRLILGKKNTTTCPL